ncbi:tigger transposable element-derived protein 1-like protein [Trichonephila clavata]|uniref:Tigger transposable element-derived protein 1-like protein n=1 Tax=Trichonephila clavata TaxID=2740835 RepID=A0A8X6KU69_TRICU|nr:tigger transposable element-derived protein 1-like protein [Trichonephila clavata]
MKQEIIRRSECGVKQCDLVKEFGLNKTTIFTILTNKDAIKSAKVAKGVSKLFNEKHRSSIHEEMERLLAIWIKDRQVKGDVTTQDIICHKAKIIYEDLKKTSLEVAAIKIIKKISKPAGGGFLDLRKGMESTALICMVRLAVLIKKKQKSSLLIFKNLLWMKDTATTSVQCR